MKTGIATRFTQGEITDFGWRTQVEYPKSPSKFITLEDQIQLKFNPSTEAGDSGSAIVLPDGRIAAILVGADQNGFSYATPIHYILEYFPGLSL